MPTAYTTLLGLALPADGELQGTWGDEVNNYITNYLDAAVAGTQNISTDADVTLTKTTGTGLGATSSQYSILLFTGARAALRTVTVPAASKSYVVINATTGGFAVNVVGAGPTTGVTISNGEKAIITWNGSDFVKVCTFNGVAEFSGVTVTGTTRVQAAATQDAVVLAGRAGGTASYALTITPTTLSANRTATFPNASITVAGVNATQTWSAVQTFQQSSAATNTVLYPLQVDRQSTGTPAVGIGVGINFRTETSVSNTETGAVIEAVTTNTTAAAEEFALVVKTMSGGAAAAERVRFDASGVNTIGGSLSATRAGTPSQYVSISDATASGALVTSYSATNNAKPIYINATTDVSNTAPTSGTCSVAMQVLGVTKAVFGDADFTVSVPQVVSGNFSGDAFRITQTGTGLALKVEDSANPDSTPFSITAEGQVGIGSIPSDAVQLSVGGSGTTNAQSNAVLVRTIARPDNSTTFSLVRTWSYTADNGGVPYTIGNLNHYAVQKVTWSADSTVTNHRGFSVESTFDGGTNDYAFHARNPAGTNNWAFYADQAASYFGGDVTFAANVNPGVVISGSTSSDALRITQLGTGNALLVEDTTNPDASPFVIDSAGRVAIGGAALSTAGLHIPRTVTANTGYAVNVNPTLEPAAGTDSFAIRSIIDTSSTGSISNVYDFAAIGGTNGGVSATNHYGFFAAQTLSNLGGNTYGFYSALNSGSNRWAFYGNGTAPSYFGGDVRFDKTVTAGGTTGAQTINKNAGSVNFAAAATSLVVTNSLVTTSSIIIATVATNDATMTSVQAVAGSGSFTLYANAAATAVTRVNFIVIN